MSKISVFKKNDIIVVFVLLLLAAAGLFVFRLAHRGEGKIVRVTIDGELFGEYLLGSEALGYSDEGDSAGEEVLDAVAGGEGSVSHYSDSMKSASGNSELQATEKSGQEIIGAYELQRIEIPGVIGRCYLVIDDGAAYMESADCPNQICVHHNPVSHKGETIVCLPNRIIVEID